MHLRLSRFFKEENQSRRDFLKWWWWRALLGLGGLWIGILFFMPLAYLFAGGWQDATWLSIQGFLKTTFTENIFYPFVLYGKWLWNVLFFEPRHVTWSSYFSWRILLIPTIWFVWKEVHFITENPNQFTPQTMGMGRVAKVSDLKRFGLLTGKYLFCGTFEGHKMKLPDPRSVFCIGAPGCGKTAGVVIPAVLEGDNMCMIINDPKGEIAKATSGHRAKLGPVFKMNWAGIDQPEKGIFWPSWNPIGGKNLPPLHAGREGYIDDLIYFLIPDGPTGTDPYWVKAGRGCLTGLTGYITGKVEQAKANDYFLARIEENALDDEDYKVLLSYYSSMRDFPEVKQAIMYARQKQITKENYLPIGKWSIIPDSWRQGQDACFAMLLDVISNSQVQINKALKQRQDEGDPTVMMTDAWKELLDEIVLETAYYGYGRRTLLELNQVLSLPDKQRASVISMALSGINIFKNSAVRARTSMNDFNYEQLRGIKDEKTGQFKPITIYMSVPFEDLQSSIQISTLFINMATGYLMSKGANEEIGPYPMGFILDEFHHMPSLQSISDGIVFGRAKQNMFLVVVQDWHQISAQYSEEKMNIIISSVAVKIIKRQNNPETRNLMMKGIMMLTKKVHSYKEKQNMLAFGPFQRTHSVKTISDTVVGGTGILKLANDKALVLYSGHLDRPIDKVTTPLFFKNRYYKSLASLPPAPNMPAEMQKARLAEGMEAVFNIQVDF